MIESYKEALKLLYPNTFTPVVQNMTQEELINHVLMNPPESFKEITSLGRTVSWSEGKLCFRAEGKEKWFKIFDEDDGSVNISVINRFLNWVKEERTAYFKYYIDAIFIKAPSDITTFGRLRERFVNNKADTFLVKVVNLMGWTSITYRLGERLDVNGTTVIDCADPKKWAEELINYQIMLDKAIKVYTGLKVVSNAELTPSGKISLMEKVYIVTAETDVQEAYNSILQVCRYLTIITMGTSQPLSELKLTQGYGLTWRDMNWPDLRKEDPASIVEQINDQLAVYAGKVPYRQVERLFWLLYPSFKPALYKDNDTIRLEDGFGLIAIFSLQEDKFWKELHKFREDRLSTERGYSILKDAGYKPNVTVHHIMGRAVGVETPEGKTEFYASLGRTWHDLLSSFTEFLKEAENKISSQNTVVGSNTVVESNTQIENSSKTILHKTRDSAHFGASIVAAGRANKAAVDLLFPLFGGNQKAAIQFIGPLLAQWAALRVKNEHVSDILSRAADLAQIHLGTQLVDEAFNFIQEKTKDTPNLLLTQDTLQDMETISIKVGEKVV